jgi:hypothetical protein
MGRGERRSRKIESGTNRSPKWVRFSSCILLGAIRAALGQWYVSPRISLIVSCLRDGVGRQDKYVVEGEVEQRQGQQ